MEGLRVDSQHSPETALRALPARQPASPSAEMLWAGGIAKRLRSPTNVTAFGFRPGVFPLVYVRYDHHRLPVYFSAWNPVII